MKDIKSIIAISGKFCSGKDTLANEIVKLDPRYKVVHLADLLKEDIAKLMGIPVETINSNKQVFRGLLQQYGVARRQWDGEDYWVYRLEKWALARDYTHLIVADVRFRSELVELEAIASEMHSIRLVLPVEVIVERYLSLYGVEPTEEQMTHEFETALDDLEALATSGVRFNQLIMADGHSPSLIARIVGDTLYGREFDFLMGVRGNVAA